MADIIKELMESLGEFEREMNKDLGQFKYDDALEKYVNLRFKFLNIYDDNDISLNSKAHDIITSYRNQTKYIKNDEALENIKNIGNVTKSLNADNLDEFITVNITKISRVNVITHQKELKYLFNNESTYEKDKKYLLNEGTYIFTNVPFNNPIGFLIYELEDSSLISYYGENLYEKTKDNTKPGRFRIEKFYYGKVIVCVKGDFKKVSVYCYNNGYLGLSNTFIFSKDAIRGYDLVCLKPKSEVVIYQDGESFKFGFNGDSSYDENRKYGLDLGTYILEDVPESHPIGIMTYSLSNHYAISVEGDYLFDKTINLNHWSLTSPINFYYGNIRVKVLANFGSVNVRCYNHENMGGDNLFIFSKDCPKPTGNIYKK
tara:strand:+ start:21 stop:1139 length:1119 start_codon:yes stop_codon:yes gene_type:complete